MIALLAWLRTPAMGGAPTTGHQFGSDGCVTCHTPHRQAETGLAWNPSLKAGTFTWTDARETTGHTRLPANLGTWVGATTICLACHDGTVAAGTGMMRGRGDLSGTHPVGVPYPSSGAGSYNGITTGRGVIVSQYRPNPSGVKLYAERQGVGQSAGIECASCHDPHGSENHLLRARPAELCTKCHVM